MNSTDHFAFLLHMTEDERAVTLKMSISERGTLAITMILAVIWGSLMKAFIYYSLGQEKLSARPINILILMDQIIDHITKVSAATNGVITLYTNWSTPAVWKNLLGIDWPARNICIGYSAFGYFMTSYASVGSLGIAVYRLLYFNATKWVKSKNGELALLSSTILSIIGVTLLLSLSTGAGIAARSVTFNRCLGHTATFEENYLLYSNGEVIHETLVMKLYPLAVTALQVLELSCYISLYKAVSKHNDYMSQNQVISRDTHSRRKQKNLFSMYAQVSGFILEVMYLIFLIVMRIIGRRYSLLNAREYADFLYVTQFGLTSTIQILVSSDLRLKLFNMLKLMFRCVKIF